jgi:purine-binding chemotaxis protein CheW
MTEAAQSPALARLREDFDLAFAEAPPQRVDKPVGLLAVEVGGHPYALSLAEIGGLVQNRRLWPGLGAAPGYLGLAGLKGALLPVWDLAQILGRSTGLTAGSTAKLSAAWLAVVAGESPWAVAFGRFDGYLSPEPGDLRPYAGEGPTQGFLEQAYVAGDLLRPVIRLASVLDAVKGRCAR